MESNTATRPAGSDTPLRTVGVLGLGIMGSSISVNLAGAGFTVLGYDPMPGAAPGLEAAGGRRVASAAELIRGAECLVTSLPSEAVLDQVVGQLLAEGRPGLVVAETSTFSIAAKEQAAARLAEKGIVLLDCPISGTGAQAVTRDLAIYASGDATAVARMEPVLLGFARAVYNIGAIGNGMRMKFMANLLVAIHNVSAAEALLMGARMGIDIDLAVKVLSDGAGSSRMLQVRGPMMGDRSWDQATMKVETWQKDMKLIAAELAAANVPAPTFTACIPLYNAAMGMGHAKDDTASVYDVLERMSAPRDA